MPTRAVKLMGIASAANYLLAVRIANYVFLY